MRRNAPETDVSPVILKGKAFIMSMNNAYLERAKKMIPDPQILSVVAAKRAKQLALGARPMVKCDSENYLDWALLEIAEGLLSYEFGTPGEPNSELPTLGADQDAGESGAKE